MARLPALLLLIAAGLTAWVMELGAILQGTAQVRNWSSTWVGLDLMEITGLIATALLLHRRSPRLPVAAAVTATLFFLDAWFDVLSAQGGLAWYESLGSAIFGEIPAAVLLALIALYPQRFTRRPRSAQRHPRSAQRHPRSAPWTPLGDEGGAQRAVGGGVEDLRVRADVAHGR
jgi:hypothetical protein